MHLAQPRFSLPNFHFPNPFYLLLLATLTISLFSSNQHLGGVKGGVNPLNNDLRVNHQFLNHS